MILAAAALTGLTLLGPRMLNETEIRTQRRAPLPHTAEADTATARRTDPVSGPAAPARPGRTRRHLPRPINRVRDAACRAT